MNFPPIESTSYYVGSTNQSQIYALGQSDGTAALQCPDNKTHLVILDIGTPGASGGIYGAWMPRNKGFVPVFTGGALAQQYALGWLNRTSGTNHQLWLAFGVNNFGSGVVQTNASAWSTLSYARGVACFAEPVRVPPTSKPGTGRHRVRVGRSGPPA